MVFFPTIKKIIEVILISMISSTESINCKVEAKRPLVFFSQNCIHKINQSNTFDLKDSKKNRNI